MDKISVLEEKIKKAIDLINNIKKENEDMKNKLKDLEAFKNDLEKLKDKRNKAKGQVEEILETIDKIQLDLKL
jgi:succinate dehydrogenase/fumarate reductase flavoprotein subunit